MTNPEQHARAGALIYDKKNLHDMWDQGYQKGQEDVVMSLIESVKTIPDSGTHALTVEQVIGILNRALEVVTKKPEEFECVEFRE